MELSYHLAKVKIRSYVALINLSWCVKILKIVAL